MVYWITGRANSGKTSLAYRIAKQINGIVVDADVVREVYPTGFTEEERYENVMRIARIAKVLELSGYEVVVACISPRKEWRQKAQSMFDNCLEIMLPFGELWEGTYYEED